MIKSVVVVLAIVLVGSYVVSAKNYCTICSGGSHIGCGNTGAFGSACPSDRSMVSMTSDLKDAIVNLHNTKRNTIASGSLSGFKSAERMATMQWNEELAKLAEFNVKRCIYGHDKCHNTDQFKHSGQNIAKKWWSGGNPSDLSVIAGQIDAWWAEYKDANMNQINRYPPISSKTIGHFTVMAADKNTALGCAAIKFRDRNMKNWNSLTLACNYATTNMIGKAIYASGAIASKCTSGRNPNFRALCSQSELY